MTISREFFLDILWEIVYFPIWWYSRGLKKTAFFCWQKIQVGWRALAVLILLRNFFKPMYGQRGWDAYLLSLATHFCQLAWRFIAVAFWSVFWLAVLSGWLILPIFLIWQII